MLDIIKCIFTFIFYKLSLKLPYKLIYFKLYTLILNKFWFYKKKKRKKKRMVDHYGKIFCANTNFSTT